MTSIVVNLKFHRAFFEKHQGEAAALLRAYFRGGGQQVQVNVCDKEELKDAVLHPERHQDLIVRVGGYSDYFVRLSPALQQEIILRKRIGGLSFRAGRLEAGSALSGIKKICGKREACAAEQHCPFPLPCCAVGCFFLVWQAESGKRKRWRVRGKLYGSNGGGANIALDVVSIILSLLPVVYLLGNHRYRQERSNRYFLGVCVSNLLMIVGDLPDWLIQDASGPLRKIVLTLSSALFYTASAFVLYFFGRYILEYLQVAGRTGKRYLAAITAVRRADFFCPYQPLQRLHFYVADDGYQRGSLFFISQLVPLFCYLLFTALVILYRKRLAWQEIVFSAVYFRAAGRRSDTNVPARRSRGQYRRGAGAAVILVNIQFEHELLLKRQEKELAEQRIDMMLSQIQPHFLYNTLTTIRQLCDVDPQKAKAAIRDFFLFLRGNMDSLKKQGAHSFRAGAFSRGTLFGTGTATVSGKASCGV